MRNSIRILSVFITIIVGTFSLYALLIGARVLSPSLYTDALLDAGVYEQAANVVESRVEYALVSTADDVLTTLEKEVDEEDTLQKVLIWVVGDIIENNAGTAVSSLSDRIGLENRLEGFVNSDIEYVLALMKGETDLPRFFEIIPDVDTVDSLEKEGVLVYVAKGVAVEALGVSELPECANQREETEALKAVDEDRLKEVLCISEDVKPILEDKIEETLPAGLLERLEENFNKFLDEYGLEPLWQDLLGIVRDLAELKQEVTDAQNYVIWYRSTALIGLAVAIVFGMVAVLLSPKERIQTFFRLNLIISGILVIAGVIFNIFFARLILNSIDFSNFELSTEYVSNTQNALWVQSLETSADLMLKGIHDYVFQVGIWWFLIAGVLYGLINYLIGGGWDDIKQGISNGWKWLREKLQALVDWWDGKVGEEAG